MSGCSGGCSCNSAPTLIFPCSGAADVGELADRAARQLSRSGAGSMYCLAGIGGRVNAIMLQTAVAGAIIAIDGCRLDCAAHTLAQAGFDDIIHVRITDLGMKKGSTVVTDESVAMVAGEAAAAAAEKGCCP